MHLALTVIAFLLAALLPGWPAGTAQARADHARMDSDGQRTVVLLHGLIRSKGSMKRMERALEKEGYRVCNIGYPSTRYDIQELASDHVYPAVIACVGDGESKIDFVTHSLGGILVRQLADELLSERMGRVVMLSPPNGGSEVVDRIGDWWLFKALNGPAGTELGTESTSVPNQLGPPSFEVGIITGKRTINLINSIMIEGQDDGKVSVENARLEGMSDFLVLPVSHPFIMKNRRAIEATHRFLDTGHFAPVAGA